MSNVDLYVLSCPDSGKVRYAGKANCASKRLKSHLRDAKRRDTPVYRWINKLLINGKCPVIRIVKTVSSDEWENEEKKLISDLRNNGCRHFKCC